MHEALPRPGAGDAWDPAVCDSLIDELQALRAAMVEYELRLEPWQRDIAPPHRDSARNLAHYLALRRVDLRRLQERLAWIGLSSLGRSESHVLANLDKVLGILHVLTGRGWTPHTADEPLGYRRGAAMLARNAETLFGTAPAGRSVRVMVTLPTEAAFDDALILGLIAAGMDIARINCAHDDARHWVAMSERVRAAARSAGRNVRVLMDLAGPKLRTGSLPDGPAVLKIKPARDALGMVTAPARIGLRARGACVPVPGAALHLEVDAAWLAQLRAGDRIDLSDARDAERTLTVVQCSEAGALVEAVRTTYVTPDTALRIRRRKAAIRDSLVHGLEPVPGALTVHRGERVRLVRDGTGHPARAAGRRRKGEPATIACTLPQALDAVAQGGPDLVRRRAHRRRRAPSHQGRRRGRDHRRTRRRRAPCGPTRGSTCRTRDLRLPSLTDKDVDDLGRGRAARRPRRPVVRAVGGRRARGCAGACATSARRTSA